MRIHPSLRELSRLADRELDENRQREVHEHLGECQRCRDQVVLMRDLGRAARSISHPSPPEDALSRILERRAAGDRVILPVSAALRSSRRRKAIGIAAGIGGTLLAATLLLLPANEASAGASDLRFDPVQAVPGDHIEVTYLPTSALAAEDILYLRGAFRSPGDPAPRRGLPGAVRIELHPHPDGTFSGTVQMPHDAVFGYFAVENQPASEVDVKGGRFWAILAHDDGVPTREALLEQLEVLDLDDVEFGLMAADMLLEYYPYDVVGRRRKLAYEGTSTIGSQLETVMSERRRLRDLGASDHPAAAPIRLEAELENLGDEDPLLRLEVYEREWMQAGLSDDYLVARAFRQALQGQDPDAVLRWARRHNRVRPEETGLIAEDLARFPSLRKPAKDGIRAEVKRLETPSAERRNLGDTRAEFLASDRQRVRSLLGTLGRLLLEEGRYEAAIDTLELAIAEGWNSEAFRSLAESYAAVGDTSEALTLYAYVAAGERDPQARRDVENALQRRFGALSNHKGDWAHRVAESRAQIAQRLIVDAGTHIRPAGNPLVWDRDGESRPLSSLSAGDVAIVVFWTGRPQMLSLTLGEEMGEPAGQESPGIEIITITENLPSAELDRLLREEGISLRVFYDRKWEAAQSLNVIGIPYLYVVDQRGRFYFAEDMEQAIRLAESLRRTAAATA